MEIHYLERFQQQLEDDCFIELVLSEYLTSSILFGFLSCSSPYELISSFLHNYSFTDNAGLCGIPGLPPCGPRLSLASKIGIGVGLLVAVLLILLCSVCWWKRRQNILRAQQLAGRSIYQRLCSYFFSLKARRKIFGRNALYIWILEL